MHMDKVREELIRAEAAEGWTEEDQLEAENSPDYQNYLAQADDAFSYTAEAEAKLQAALQGDYTPAARHHEPDPLQGIGEESQDLDK